MKTLKISLICLLLFGLSNSTNAQLWKKLKKKVQQKVEQKIDKEADKIIDKTLNGKKKDGNNINKDKDFGDATINHSNTYGSLKINHVTQTKVNKKGNEFTVSGNWWSSTVDVYDGYKITIKNTSLEELAQGKTFQIPSQATFYIGYDPLLGERENRKNLWKGSVENNIKSGSVTITFTKDKSVSISYTANGTLSKYIETNAQLDQGYYDKKPITIDGSITSTSPKFTITKEIKEKKIDPVNKLSENEKIKMLKKATPTVNIPSTFSFNKSIEVKMTDERGDTQTINFLTGDYPDIYGLSIAPKEMQGQQMLVINTPKSSSMFMDMGGMKIKKSTSLEQMGSQYNMDDKLPEDGDFQYKKTGNTKTIIGYLCEEVKVEYDYTNSKGSVSFWLSKDFPIQNKSIPMLGMRMNNPNFSGFVLEMNTIQNGKKFTLEVVNVSDKSVNINTNEYKKMGF